MSRVSPSAHRYIDIGANLLDGMFVGKYHGKRVHTADRHAVLQRAHSAGVESVIVTCSNLKDSRRALAWAQSHNATAASDMPKLYCTVGVHPTNTMQLESSGAEKRGGDTTESSGEERTGEERGGGERTGEERRGGVGRGGERTAEERGGEERAERSRTSPNLSKDEYIAALEECIRTGVASGTVVAIGECGLDYDRLFFSPKEVQLRHFGLHFALSEMFSLPLFLHDRNTGGDFAAIMREHRHRIPGGVVHSFTGSMEELATYLDMGLYIGINGCSLKTEDNLAVVKAVPLDRLMLETDAPWCEIRKSHASYKHVRTLFPSVKKEKHAMDKLVQSRCEPCQMVQVAEVVAAVKGITMEELTEAVYKNTQDLFFSAKKR